MKAVKLSTLKKGDFFTLKPIEDPAEHQYRSYKGDKIVYVDFYF